MKKAMGIIIALALIFIIAGVILVIVGGSNGGWDVKYTDESFTSSQNINRLELDVSAGKANVEFYDGDKVEITYQAHPKYGFTASEKDGTVKLSHSRRSWFDWGSRKAPVATVRVPSSLILSLNVEIGAGSVIVQGGEFTSVKLDVSAGSVEAGELKCGAFDCHVSAGAAKVAGVTCTTTDIDVSAGSVNVTVTCDDIDVDVSAGTVNLTVRGVESEYNVSVDKSAGKCNVSGHTGTVAGKRVDVDVSAGTVNVYFN